MFIHKGITKANIQGKGVGYVSNSKISRGTIVLKERPQFTISENTVVYSDIFQLLFLILNSSNSVLIKKFKALFPRNIDSHCVNKKMIGLELEKVKKHSREIYEFFITNFSFEEICLYCTKYISNAFNFCGRPVVLFCGTLFNHSCVPNVVFGIKDDQMVFISAMDINKAEELTINYIDITLNFSKRQSTLRDQYGFICKCPRCISRDKKKFGEHIYNIESLKKKCFLH